MNELTVNVSMTTVEIAELTGKRHDNVMRDTRGMLAELYSKERLLKFEETYKHPQNSVTYPMFRLPPDEVMDPATAARMGKQASAICRQNGYSIGRVPDARYGHVNTYPCDVLDQITCN